MNLYTRQPPIEPFEIVYPDGDGQPMTESDPTRDYLIYCVEALNIYFQQRSDVYISGNLFRLAMGMSVEQVAEVLGLRVEEGEE